MEETVYEGQIVRVTEEKIGAITWERVYVPSGVVIFPITDEGKILLIHESRPHETPPHRIKAVSGILEAELGSPEENAQREMQEEIGFKAREMELLHHMKGTGTINHEQYFFVARGLIPSKLPNPDGEEVILDIIALTPHEIKAKLISNELKWSHSTLGLLKLLLTHYPEV